jgi:PAS domain S-box-containing protein
VANFAGLFVVFAFVVLLGLFFVSGFSQSIFNPPYLAFILQLFFVFGVGLAVVFVSAKSYVQTGAPNILFLGNAILISSLAFTVSATVLTPQIPPTLTANQAVIIGNVGVLISSLVLLVSAIVTFRGTEHNPRFPKKTMLAVSFLISIATVTIISVFSALDLFPVFLTSSGPTPLRLVVLALTTIFYFASSVLFGWKYVRAKSQIVYWFSLALALFGAAYLSGVLTVHLGSGMTWISRLALYLSGTFLLFALLGPEGKTQKQPYAEKWTEAFRSNPKQAADFFSRMLDAFAYFKILINKEGKPIDYVILDVNDAFEKLTGLNKNDVLGKKASEIMNSDALEDWLSILGPVAFTGEPVTLDHFSKFSKKWVHMTIYSTQQNYLVSISEDITERKKAEDALLLSEERFSKAFNLSPFAVIMTSLSDGTYVDVNDTFLKMFELSREEVIGHTANEIKIYSKPDGRAAYLASFKNGRVSDFEVDLKTKSGKPLKALGFAEIINLNGQDLTFGTLVDVTERKQAELKLEEYRNSLEKLVFERTKKLEISSLYARNLIEASLDPLVTISAEGKITDVNKATEQVTGCSKEHLIGSDFSDYFTEPEKAEVGYKQVFTEGFVRDYPLAIKDKSGKVTEVLYNATVYRNDAGEIEGVFAAARDITVQKKAEKEAKEAEKKLKDSERLAAIGATAGMVGHDIRNPLQAITGDLFLAKSELSELPENENKTNAIESLDEIQNNIDYINKIVADLQDYARPLNPRAQETNIKSLFHEILAKNGIPKNIKVTVKVEDKAEKIMADPDYLKRIAANLTLNAVQAMPNGGKLTIRAYSEKQTNDVLITIKDTGVGIPEDIKPKLFTPMMTTKSKGQGFGLAVVKRMTEGLGGTVTFESSQGKGTTFIVRLPLPKELNGKLVYK